MSTPKKRQRCISPVPDKVHPSQKKLKVVEGSASEVSTSKLQLQVGPATELSAVLTEDEKLHEEPEWRCWGCFLPERQWGTVREDSSSDGNCWASLPFEDSSKTAFRCGEDGLMGFCDNSGLLCFSLALWNGKDHCLKEKLFGLTNPQGNHGESVKEVYHYLSGVPSNSYMKAMYRYPHAEFPYKELIKENAKRTLTEPEYQLEHTGIFNDNRFHDIFIEYAKSQPNDMLCCVTAHNRSSEPVPLHLLPTAWFRNIWQFDSGDQRPSIHSYNDKNQSVVLDHPLLGGFIFRADSIDGLEPEILFTQNETRPNSMKFENIYKDAFHQKIIHEVGTKPLTDLVHPSKCALHFCFTIPSQSSVTIKCSLCPVNSTSVDFDAVLSKQRFLSGKFYSEILRNVEPEVHEICKQAFSGLCWSKQTYWYEQSAIRSSTQRNHRWKHMRCKDVILMPDKWEFPWFAAWDWAFHCIVMLDLDLEFAQQQLLLLLSEEYQHPNGQLPGCEFNFDDPNPPVHAWACMKAYQHKSNHSNKFLETCFHRLELNHAWWISHAGSFCNVGFLGMDNVSIVNRSELPTGCVIYQVDAASWVAFNALQLMEMALELGLETAAVKYLDSFIDVAHKIQDFWCPEAEFFFDYIEENASRKKLRIFSMVGLIPLFACKVLKKDKLTEMKKFSKRIEECSKNFVDIDSHEAVLFSAVSKDQSLKLIQRIFDEDHFLAPCGIRSLSKYHKENPFALKLAAQAFSISYTPAESTSRDFGGNSNWRGPVWLPVNYLLIESFLCLWKFYQENLLIHVPSHGKSMNLGRGARLIQKKIVHNIKRDQGTGQFLFHEFFNGDSGEGCGASHQTGWSALIATIICSDDQMLE